MDRIKQAADSDWAAQLEQVTEFTVNNFEARVRVLLKALDCGSNIHPFIASMNLHTTWRISVIVDMRGSVAASMVFKAVVNLEITWRKNELHVQYDVRHHLVSRVVDEPRSIL